MSATDIALLGAGAVCAVELGRSFIGPGRAPKAPSQGFDAQLPYSKLIGEGLMELTRSRLMVSYEVVDGVDAFSLALRNYVEHVLALNNGYIGLDENFQMNIDELVSLSPGYSSTPSYYYDPVTEVLHESRIRYFETPGNVFTTRQYVTLTMKAPSFMERALSGELGEADILQAVESLETTLGEFIDALRPVATLRRLSSAGQLSFVLECITGVREEVAVPPIPIVGGLYTRPMKTVRFLSADVRPGRRLRVGDGTANDAVEVITIADVPELCMPGGLDTVGRIQVPLRRSTRAIYVDTPTARAKIDKKTTQLLGNIDGIKTRFGMQGARDVGAASAASEAEQKFGQTSLGKVKFLHWTSAVVVRGRTHKELREQVRKVMGAFKGAQFIARRETVGANDIFVSTLPGDDLHGLSEALGDTVELGSIAPLHTTYKGPDSNPNPNYAGAPPLGRFLTVGHEHFDFYESVSDVRFTGIVGEQGTGKTVTQVGLLELDRAEHPSAINIVFDNGRNFAPYVDAAGGVVHSLDPAIRDGRGFNPFQLIADPAERAEVALWLAQLFELENVQLTSAHRELIAATLAGLAHAPRRSMTLFQSLLATRDRELAKALTYWTVAGVGGYLLDSEDEHMDDNPLQVFEMSRLVKYGERLAGPVIAHVTRRLLQRVGQGQHVTVRIDEADVWFKSIAFSPFIVWILDKARKLDLGLVIGFQRLEQAIGTPVFAALFNGIPTWIFMADKSVASGERRKLFRETWHLSERALDMIASTLTQKRNFMLWQNKRASVINAQWTSEELAFIGCGSDSDLRLYDKLRREHGVAWPEELLRRRGLHAAAEQLARKRAARIAANAAAPAA